MGTTEPGRECKWQQDSDGNWDTACGETFIFEDGSPSDNRQRFCGYCGAPIIESLFMEDDDAGDDDAD